MGEISFKYIRKFEPIYETPFKYWFADSKEYSFAYQRYIASSDTSVFNNPVAISKIATGFYNLCDLFVDKTIHPSIEQKMNNIKKNAKNISIKDILIDTYKNNYDISIQNILSLIIINNDKLLISKNEILAYKENPNINIIYTANLFIKDKQIANNIENISINKYNHLMIYDNKYILKKLTGININLYHNMYNLHKDNHLKILRNDIAYKPRLGFNILPMYIVQTDTKKMNIYWNKMITPYTNILNRNDKEYLCKFKNKIGFNILPTILCYGSNPIMNVIYQIHTNKPIIYSNILNSFDCKIYDKHLNLINIVNSATKDKTLNVYNILNGYMYNKQLSIYNNVNCFIPNKYIDFSNITYGNIYNKNLSSLTQASGSIDNDNFNTINDVIYKKDNTKNFFTENQYSVIKNNKNIYKLDIDTFTIIQDKYIFTINNVFNTVNTKDLMIKYGIWNTLNYENIFESNISYFTINPKNIDTISNNLFMIKNKFNLFTYNNNIFNSKQYKNIFTTSRLFIENNPLDTSYKNDNVFNSKQNRNIMFSNNSFVSNKPKPIWIKNNIHISNKSRYITLFSNPYSIYKKEKYLTTYKNIISLNNKYDNIFTQDKIFINKSYRDFSFIKYDIWSIKDKHKLYLLTQITGNKDKHMIDIYKKGRFILKQCVSIDLFDIDTVIKNKLPGNIICKAFSEFDGMIIPISKIRHQTFIDYIDNIVSKYSKNGYISQGIFSSILPKNVQCNLNIFCDKNNHKVFIDYKNNQITKSKIYTYIHNDIFTKKYIKNSSINYFVSVSKDKKETWIKDVESVVKAYHNGFINKDEFSKLKIKKYLIENSIFIDKIDKICYYDYGTLTNKQEYETLLQQNLYINTKNRNIQLADFIPNIIRKKLKSFYEYSVFSNKIITKSQLYKQMLEIDKISKDLMIQPDDFGNWAWVYETPDPIDVTYGIDELLLPENDTRYSDFENIIFNKNTMRPRNPIKIINDTTFIAKYPHKHPLPKYNDIAVNYDDSAVKYEQYYGIETSIMHTVFLKYYRIWQNKIFEFSTMTMVQSVKKMLEYLYVWIMEYFPLDEIEQALRVLKLIRWYGESAIIQNSQYIVTYEYDTLESKLTSGSCLIPNNLDTTTNDSMIIDSSLGVIKNNPIYVGINDAYVEFYIDNRKNTSITFSLSNTVGSVNIYINDILVDVVSHSALNLTYQIPYTGDTNIVKIEKLASHNLNNHFYIGNIKVPNLSFKDLSIEFDPTLKIGNKPLDEIAKKMIQYANIYDDVKDVYQIMQKNNIGIQETYNKMIEYWNLHHQQKTKGKRLTIKQI